MEGGWGGIVEGARCFATRTVPWPSDFYAAAGGIGPGGQPLGASPDAGGLWASADSPGQHCAALRGAMERVNRSKPTLHVNFFSIF